MSTHKRYQQISAAVAHGRDHQREPWGRHAAALHAPGLFPRMVSRGTNSENINLTARSCGKSAVHAVGKYVHTDGKTVQSQGGSAI